MWGATWSPSTQPDRGLVPQGNPPASMVRSSPDPPKRLATSSCCRPTPCPSPQLPAWSADCPCMHPALPWMLALMHKDDCEVPPDLCMRGVNECEMRPAGIAYDTRCLTSPDQPAGCFRQRIWAARASHRLPCIFGCRRHLDWSICVCVCVCEEEAAHFVEL